MKNRILLLIITLVIIGTVTILLLNKKETPKGIEIEKIEYASSGGFGTRASTAKKTITITSDGKVVFSNDYDDFTENTTITKEEYKELHDYIYERLSLFDEELISNNALDGGSQYLTIEFKDGKKLEFGGYMVANHKFEDIENKIYNSSFYEKYNEYEKKYSERNKD